jgi:hypothetical protein
MYTSDLFQSKSHINEDQEFQVLYIDDKPVAKYTDPMQAKTQLAHLQSKFPAKKIELKKEMREASDPSGMMHAARHYNKSFIITAELAEGGTKKYRIHAQSERVAREKFSQHYNMAKVLSVEEEGVAEGTVSESLQPGQYYVATVTLDDGETRRFKVTWDEGYVEDINAFYAKQGRKVADIKMDWDIKGEIQDNTQDSKWAD